ncbi:MAG: helix-turn-helix transcriptional regulator [Eubacterium sp.]|nr:helix-turn-helix transcriptional regulator [Eubacterium sp.]
MVPTIYWGNILRSLRKKKDLTQKEVAAILHITRQTYSGYENGRIHPSPESIAILSEVYDIDIYNYIFALMPDSFVAETAEYKKNIKRRLNNSSTTPNELRKRRKKMPYMIDMDETELG